MPRIALIVPYCFVPPRNGGHKAAFGFSAALAKKKQFLVLSTDNNAPVTEFRLLPLFPDRPSKYFLPRFRNRVKAALEQEGVTHIMLFQHYQAALLRRVLQQPGISWSVYVQNLEFQRWRSLGKWWWPLMRRYETWAYKKADKLFFISPDDREAGIHAFDLPASKCEVVAYGIHRPAERPPVVRREEITARHGLAPEEKLILFFGPQDYQPNLDAVLRTARRIVPALKKATTLPFRVLICGGGLPAAYKTELQSENLLYLGFVPDIEAYIQAADVMINPILSGGGVKTKILESIASGTPVVSFATGATGIDTEVCGHHLRIVRDEDDPGFAKAVTEMLAMNKQPVPLEFYDRYEWRHTIQPVLDWVSGQS